MGFVPPQLLLVFPRPRKPCDPKEEHPSVYSEGMKRVLDSTHCQDCGEYIEEGYGHICLDPWLGVGRESHDQDIHSEWIDSHRGGGQSNIALINQMKAIEAKISYRVFQDCMPDQDRLLAQWKEHMSYEPSMRPLPH